MMLCSELRPNLKNMFKIINYQQMEYMFQAINFYFHALQSIIHLLNFLKVETKMAPRLFNKCFLLLPMVEHRNFYKASI